jgi:hypothetical protein
MQHVSSSRSSLDGVLAGKEFQYVHVSELRSGVTYRMHLRLSEGK